MLFASYEALGYIPYPLILFIAEIKVQANKSSRFSAWYSYIVTRWKIEGIKRAGKREEWGLKVCSFWTIPGVWNPVPRGSSPVHPSSRLLKLGVGAPRQPQPLLKQLLPQIYENDIFFTDMVTKSATHYLSMHWEICQYLYNLLSLFISFNSDHIEAVVH